MADTSLGFSSKLQIIIVPSGKTYTTSTEGKHVLVFREGENIIEVNGVKYQATSSTDLTAITTALKNTGYLTTGSDGALTATDPGTVAALLGTKISTATSGTTKTVSAWIDDILGKISGINTNITNINGKIASLQKATATDGSGNFVVRDKTGSGKTDFANTTAIQEAINTAKTNAINAAAGDATTKVNAAKEALIGTGATSESITKPLEVESGKTWALNETKTLSSLKDLILNLQGQLNTLTNTNLEEVNNAIAAIKKELVDGQGSGLTTIIDGLKVFLDSGLTTGGASYTVNGKTCTSLQQIITALETEIKARIASVGKGDGETLIDVTTDSNKKVTVSSTQHLKTAVTNANSAIQSVKNGTNESLISVSTSNKAVIVSSTDSLKTAVTNANSAIQSVDEVSGEALIAVNTTDKNVTVSSTPKLQTAVTTANNALPKGQGNTYTSAVDLANKLKGTAGDSKDKTTIEGAKTYAKETAKSYADNVITWTVIS